MGFSLGGLGFAQGQMAAQEQQLKAKQLQIEEATLGGKLMQIDQERQKFHAEQSQKALADSIARMKELARAVEAVGPNYKPGSALDQAIDIEKRVLAKAAELNGVDPNIAEAMATQARALAQKQQELKAVGNSMVDPLTGEVKATVPPPPTEFEKNVRTLAGMGIQPTPEELKKGALGGGVNVNVDTGTIPTGYQAVRDANGRIIRLDPIEGGPAAQGIAQGQEQKEKQKAQTKVTGDIVVQDIDRALGLIEKAVLPAAGLGAETLATIPGTAAADVKALTDTIKANVGFERLQQMRQASPTGGALGNVSDKDIHLLESVLGSIVQSQSAEQLIRNLSRLKEIYLDIVHGPGNRPEGTGTEILQYDPATKKIISNSPNAGPGKR